MTQNTLLGSLGDQLNKLFTDSAIHEDIQKSVHALVQSAFDKLDLVTRDEFDNQLEVLQRTRNKVRELETLVEELKKQSEDPAGS